MALVRGAVAPSGDYYYNGFGGVDSLAFYRVFQGKAVSLADGGRLFFLVFGEPYGCGRDDSFDCE